MGEVGRPTKYKEAYNEQARKLCLLGYTDKDLGDFFEVNESTINEWKLSKVGFSESIKKGKQEADYDVVASLYNRAKGMIVTEEKDTDGGAITTRKELPPDTTAAIFWLKNRQGARWRDRQEVQATNTNINVELEDKEKKEALDRVRKGLSEFEDYE